MSERISLLEEMAEDLGISRLQYEKKNSLAHRVVYSAIARNAYFSLWDTGEDGLSPSEMHFQRRVCELYEAFGRLYPAQMEDFALSGEELSQELLGLYLETGYAYHTAGRVCAAREGVASFEGDPGVTLYRAPAPGRRALVSGCGAYACEENRRGEEDPLGCSGVSLFGLSPRTLREEYEALEAQEGWAFLEVDPCAEYLRTTPPFTLGIWGKALDQTGDVSLCRWGPPGQRRYLLYRAQEGRLLGLPWPEWAEREIGYLQVANAVLDWKGKLPKILWEKRGPCVRIELSYPLPRREMAVLRLYSWPESFSGEGRNHVRVMDRRAFEAVEAMLEGQGYRFEKKSAR